MAFHDPIGNIKVMDVLLANMIAAEPDIMIPIAHLLLHLCGALIATMPDRAAVDPVSSKRHHVSDCSIVNAFDSFDVTWPMPALRASRHFQIFFLCLFSGGINRSDAVTV